MNKAPSSELGFLSKLGYGLLLFVSPRRFEQRAGRRDFNQSRQHQPDLPDSNLAAIETLSGTRARAIRRQFGGALVRVLGIVIAGFLTALYVNSLALPPSAVAIVRVFGVLIVALGVLARVEGPKFQSTKGETVAEQVNKFIYRSLYHIGIYAGVVALLVDPAV